MPTSTALRLQTTIIVAVARGRQVLVDRATAARVDDRGEVTSTTIVIAALAALAIAVMVIITALVTNKANSINV